MGRLASIAGLAGIVVALAAVPATASVPSCTAVALKAVRLGVTLKAVPAACAGLRPADLEQAVYAAVGLAADHGPKPERRRLATAAGASLGYLILVAQQGQSRAAAPRPAATGPAAPAFNVPVDTAALIAWLLTAAAGASMLVRRRPGRPPSVILAHAGMATGGLLGWIGYLATREPALAWSSVALLLPVAGLGMASLVQSIPDAGTARVPVVKVTVHGIFATTTLLLVFLAAIAAR